MLYYVNNANLNYFDATNEFTDDWLISSYIVSSIECQYDSHSAHTQLTLCAVKKQ